MGYTNIQECKIALICIKIVQGVWSEKIKILFLYYCFAAGPPGVCHDQWLHIVAEVHVTSQSTDWLSL